MARIGILTGGGDCPGLNPVIRAVVRKALLAGFEIVGIKNGWKGLVENDIMLLNIDTVSGSAHSYNWTVNDINSTNCKIRISDANNSIVKDISDNSFSIEAII